MIGILVGIIILLLVIINFIKMFGHIPTRRTIQLFNKLPGPKDQPFFMGATLEILQLEKSDYIHWVKSKIDKFGGLIAFYSMGQPTVILTEPDYMEVILTSTKHIDKGPDYRFLEDWLSKGLLLSSGGKWKQRRKLLTPSFHFNILDNSTDCMNRNWKKVVKTMLNANGAPVEPFTIIGRGALNVICETAMGTILDKNKNGNQYAEAVKRATADCVSRALHPLLRIDSIFKKSSIGKRHMNDINLLHGFTEKVILERREAHGKEELNEEFNYDDSKGKKPQVFLDSIFKISENAHWTDKDIREEVDTFMFADFDEFLFKGHDTITTALQFFLFNLAHYPDVQEKVYQEQFDIFGYSDRDVTKEDMSQMHYLNQVIKESLRLHPPAPQFARLLKEDALMPNGMIIPAGTKILMDIFFLHRNPKYYPNPDAFDPNRFRPDVAKHRHPYSYLPFSAGPRNCIGQKFALMQMKIGISTIIRQCKIFPVTKMEDLKYEMIILLEPSKPIQIRITPRNPLN